MVEPKKMFTPPHLVLFWIRDLGSGILDKHPGFATLRSHVLF